MRQLAQKPILFSLAAVAVMLLLPRGIAPVVQLLFWKTENLWYGMLCLLDILAVVILTVAVGKELDQKFHFGICRDRLGQSVLLCLPMLVESVYSLFLFFWMGCPGIPFSEGMSAVLHALQSGITEELVFRCLILGNLAYQWRSRPGGRHKALLVSSLVFSLSHLVNLVSGQALLLTAVQTVYAFSVGCLTGMAYLRTRNLLGPILVHTFHNCVTMTLAIALEANVQIQPGVTAAVLCIKLLSYAGIVWLSLHLLEKSVSAEEIKNSEAVSQ